MATTKRRKQWPRRRARVMRVTADTVGPGGSGGTRTGSSPMAPPQAGQCRASPSGEDAATSVGLCVPRPTPARAISAAVLLPRACARSPLLLPSGIRAECARYTSCAFCTRKCRRHPVIVDVVVVVVVVGACVRMRDPQGRAWKLGHTRDTEPPRCMTQLLKIDLGLRRGFDADGHEIPMPILCAWLRRYQQRSVVVPPGRTCV